MAHSVPAHLRRRGKARKGGGAKPENGDGGSRLLNSPARDPDEIDSSLHLIPELRVGTDFVDVVNQIGCSRQETSGYTLRDACLMNGA